MSIGFTEILLILFVIVLLFGPKKIPELAKALGRASFEYKKAKEILKKEAEGLTQDSEDETKPQETAIEKKDE